MQAVLPDSSATKTYTDYVTYYGTDPLGLACFWIFITLFLRIKLRSLIAVIGCLIIFAYYVVISFIYRGSSEFQYIRSIAYQAQFGL